MIVALLAARGANAQNEREDDAAATRDGARPNTVIVNIDLGHAWQELGGVDAYPCDPFWERPASGTVVISEELTQAVAELDADSFDVRERATERIVAQIEDLQEVYALLAAENLLSAEQRRRLLEVVRRHLVMTPRGAVGISMNWQQADFAQPGVIVVMDVIAGLPAEGVLKPADRIVRVDGQPLITDIDFSMRVQSRRPGEDVKFSVLRPRVDERGQRVQGADGQPAWDELELTIKLGSVRDLERQPGAQVRASPVEAMRHAEAAQAAVHFAASPRLVALDASSRRLASNPRAPGAEEPYRLDDLEVEEHPYIRSLRAQKDLIRSGQMIETRELNLEWQRVLQYMTARLRDPNIGAEERLLLGRVRTRYADMMRE